MKILLIISLCLPFTLSAQWTGGGAFLKTQDNVIIGPGNDLYPLYVRKDADKWQARFANRSAAGADVFLSHGDGYGMHIRGRTTGGHYTLQLYNLDAETNVFYNNGNAGLGLIGNVGIGTRSPIEKLHINGAIRGNEKEGALRVRTAKGYVDIGPKNGSFCHFTTDRSRFYFNTAVNVEGAIGSHNRDLQLRINNDTMMTIVEDTGYVGIGTATPENALDVVGTMRAEECLIETGWADYVLSNDYQLPTLEEEEKHIEENGHLMGFESEQAMGGEISVGDVSVRQQVKIEEMMLHLIEMDKSMKAMESKISNLEQENADLKKQISK